MSREPSPRLRALAELCPLGRRVIDVGADHGYVAHLVGGVATERQPGRCGRADVPWVIADGLAPFRAVEVAVVAGMGAESIAGILARGPRPEVAVLHTPDDPPRLRRWLASHGWRIDAERLARERARIAELIRAVPGEERATGLHLELGPRLLEGGDPLLRPHLERLRDRFERLAHATRAAAPATAAAATRRIRFLAAQLDRLVD